MLMCTISVATTAKPLVTTSTAKPSNTQACPNSPDLICRIMCKVPECGEGWYTNFLQEMRIGGPV